MTSVRNNQADEESDRPVVMMKQGNACGVKGHSQAKNGNMTEPDWEAVVQTWLNPQESFRKEGCLWLKNQST